MNRGTVGLATGIAIALLAAWSPAAGAAGPAAPAELAAPHPSLAEALAEQVTGAQVYEHLRALQRIADTSGGNRGYDQPGFVRSADYVAATLQRAGYHVTRQRVPYTDFQVVAEDLTVAGLPVPVVMTRWVPSTPPTGIDAPLAALPPGRTGCTEADYAGTGVSGAVLVIARGPCGYTRQQRLATAAGARAVLLYYVTPSPENIYRFIAFTPALFTAPMASVSQRDGERLAAAARAGTVGVHLRLRAHSVPRSTENVLAETSGGSPANVVMIGGHLDSVTEGPGINDNGSMAATVLQIALALAPYQHSVPNKVRFAWWGAEELVDVGSKYYVSQLPAPARASIAALLNGELLASPNYGRFVWDPGSGGGHVIASVFAGYFASRQLPFELESPNAVGSDHEPFTGAGIAVGGLDSGVLGIKTPAQQAVFGGTAGQLFDHCYHQTCDTADTISQTALAQNAPAMAYVLGRLASYVDDVRAAG